MISIETSRKSPSAITGLPKKIRPTSGLLITYASPYAMSAFMPDNGLASLAGVLKNAGHNVQILDYCTTDTMRRLFPEKQRKIMEGVWENVMPRIKKGQKPRLWDIFKLLWVNRALKKTEKYEVEEVSDELSKVIREREVDWIGFKLWNGSGYTIPAQISSILKAKFPDLVIFGGGPQVDYFREHIFNIGAFDILVHGEGENALLRHIDRIGGSGQSIETIPFSIIREGKKIITTYEGRIEDLNVLPFPAYDEETYPGISLMKLMIFIIEESRGCDNFCNFCGHSAKSGGIIRTKSAARVVDEMSSLFEKFGAARFRFGGSSTPGDLMMQIAQELITRELKVNYSIFSRVKDANVANYPTLKKSGLFGQFFGIESGNQGILDLMNKQVSVEEAERVVKESLANGLFTALSFIYPSPGDNDSTRQETLDFILRTMPESQEEAENLFSVIINPPIVSPETAWTKKPHLFGIELDKNYTDIALTYPIKHLLPLRLWPKPPFKINGKSGRKAFIESTDFRKEVADKDVLTGFSDDTGLMAKAIGMKPRDFQELTMRYFFTGDADGLDNLIHKINNVPLVR